MAFDTGKNSNYVKDRYGLNPLDITADHIKAKVLQYFRYTRANVFMCCSEMVDPLSNCREDIVCRENRKGNVLYHAIEVKISESDFKREFWHKQEKHKERGDGRFYDYFYFAVPFDLVSFVRGYLEQEMLPYGLFGVGYDESKSLEVKLIVKASPLHPFDEIPREELIRKVDDALCARMSSEVTDARTEVYKLKDGLSEVKRQIFFLANGIKLS